MTLHEQISNDMKEAMKQKDAARLSTLRMLHAALKNKRIDLMRDLEEKDVQQVVKSQMKQLKDALATYQEAGRQEMVESAHAELGVLETYLPAQMDDAMLEDVVTQALNDAGMENKEQMGQAMGVAMKAVAGQADGSRVRAIVEKILGCIVFVISGLFIFAQEVFAQGVASAAASDTALFGDDYVVFLLRMSRVFLMVIGIPSVIFILTGAVHYATSHTRDDEKAKAIKKIVAGIGGTITVAVLFTVVTIALEGMLAG
jgi:uncharacterized protein YqeY